MSFDILEIIEDATKEADAFENHPVKELSIEEQMLYLNGLGLVMNADGEVHVRETEYLLILIKSIGLDESILQEVISFSSNPDKDTVQAFFQCFKRKPINQLFLFDAHTVARRDGKLHEKETLVVNAIADKLEILKGTQKDIFDLFCHIRHKNWQDSSVYFNSHLLNPKHFKHLLIYYDVSIDDLMRETELLRNKRLAAIIKEKLSRLKSLSILPHDVVIPMLQSELDRGCLYVVGGRLGVKDDEAIEASLHDMGLGYSNEYNSFYLDNDEKEIDISLERYLCRKYCLRGKINEQYELMADKKISIATLIDPNLELENRKTLVENENKTSEGCLINNSSSLAGAVHSRPASNSLFRGILGGRVQSLRTLYLSTPLSINNPYFVFNNELFMFCYSGERNFTAKQIKVEKTVQERLGNVEDFNGNYMNYSVEGVEGAVIYKIDKNIIEVSKIIERNSILKLLKEDNDCE